MQKKKYEESQATIEEATLYIKAGISKTNHLQITITGTQKRLTREEHHVAVTLSDETHVMDAASNTDSEAVFRICTGSGKRSNRELSPSLDYFR